MLDVHDGDTYRMRIDYGFRQYGVWQIRLHGFSCPELRDPGGIEARAAAVEAFDGAADILVETYKDRRSFERWVADVYIDGIRLGRILERQGHAVERPD